MRLFAAPWATFEPGMIVRLVEHDGIMVCDIHNNNNSEHAIGIIDSTRRRPLKKISFDKTKMVRVWTQRSLFSSDKFEPGQKYIAGNGLYVSERGLLMANRPYEDALPVARLIQAPTDKYPCFEALWI